jgi:hypothetical protein
LIRRGGSASTSLRDGIRLISRSFSWAVFENRKSMNRRAAAGWGALCAMLTVLTITTTGSNGTHSMGAP